MQSTIPLATLAIILGALFAWLVPDAPEALQLDRAALAHGELWRLLTGHVAHWTAGHLGWNLVAFAGLGTLVERWSRRRLLAALALAAPAISLAFLLVESSLPTYRGLSGLNSALVPLAIAALLREAAPGTARVAGTIACGAGLLFVAKLTWEVATGSTLFVAADATFVPVPLAHLVGALAGAIVACAGPRRASLTPAAQTPPS